MPARAALLRIGISGGRRIAEGGRLGGFYQSSPAGARPRASSLRLDTGAAPGVEVVPVSGIESKREPAFGHALRAVEPGDDARALHRAVYEGVGAQRLDEVDCSDEGGVRFGTGLQVLGTHTEEHFAPVQARWQQVHRPRTDEGGDEGPCGPFLNFPRGSQLAVAGRI